MKRGDILLVRAPNSPAGKARPCVIVQRDSVLAGTSKITVCPITSTLKGVESIRPFLFPSERNGLIEPSEVEVDWVFTVSLSRTGKTIGEVAEDKMREINTVLRRWLDL